MSLCIPRGSLAVKSEPTAASLSMAIVPPWDSMRCRVTQSPSPEPVRGMRMTDGCSFPRIRSRSPSDSPLP